MNLARVRAQHVLDCCHFCGEVRAITANPSAPEGKGNDERGLEERCAR